MSLSSARLTTRRMVAPRRSHAEERTAQSTLGMGVLDRTVNAAQSRFPNILALDSTVLAEATRAPIVAVPLIRSLSPVAGMTEEVIVSIRQTDEPARENVMLTVVDPDGTVHATLSSMANLRMLRTLMSRQVHRATGITSVSTHPAMVE